MGLDLVVEGCARPGHETEWRRLVERSFADDRLSKAEIARFNDISVPGHERIRNVWVGTDAAADAWIIEVWEGANLRGGGGGTEGVLRLSTLENFVKCDGVPIYSNGGLYDEFTRSLFAASSSRTVRT